MRGAGFAAGLAAGFFGVDPGVTAATVLCQADFVPSATLWAPFLTGSIGDVFGVTAGLSTHLFLFASAFGDVVVAAAGLLESAGMCNEGQANFFLEEFAVP